MQISQLMLVVRGGFDLGLPVKSVEVSYRPNGKIPKLVIPQTNLVSLNRLFEGCSSCGLSLVSAFMVDACKKTETMIRHMYKLEITWSSDDEARLDDGTILRVYEFLEDKSFDLSGVWFTGKSSRRIRVSVANAVAEKTLAMDPTRGIFLY